MEIFLMFMSIVSTIGIVTFIRFAQTYRANYDFQKDCYRKWENDFTSRTETETKALWDAIHAIQKDAMGLKTMWLQDNRPSVQALNKDLSELMAKQTVLEGRVNLYKSSFTQRITVIEDKLNEWGFTSPKENND